MTGSPDKAVGKLVCRLCGFAVYRNFDPNYLRIIQCKECGGLKMKIASILTGETEKDENSDRQKD